MDDAARTLPVLPRGQAGPDLDEALTALEQVQRVKAAAAALEFRLLARVDALDDSGDVQWNREQISPILRCAPRTAHGKLAMATTLINDLPQTLSALECGDITVGHANAVLEAVAPLDQAMSCTLETRVLRRCENTSVAEFRARCKRAVIALDPEGAQRRHDLAAKDRHIAFHTDQNGMSVLRAYLKTTDAAAARQHLNACTDTIVAANAEAANAEAVDAEAADAEAADRSRDAVRADVFVDLITGRSDEHSDVTARSKAPIQVTIAFSTLANIDDLPGGVDGEPVPASLARELANDPAAWWRPVLIDRDGHLEAVGARTYKPGAALRRLVQLHDRTCQFPGCRRRAASCETDHAVPFDHADPLSGGLTEFGNLHCLCKRHHRLKHEAGWTIVRNDGSTTWRSPTGRRYERPTEPYLDSLDPPPF